MHFKKLDVPGGRHNHERGHAVLKQFAIPPHYAYTQYGECLLWSGREEKARAFFAKVVEEGQWKDPYQRPSESFAPHLQSRPYWPLDLFPSLSSALENEIVPLLVNALEKEGSKHQFRTGQRENGQECQKSGEQEQEAGAKGRKEGQNQGEENEAICWEVEPAGLDEGGTVGVPWTSLRFFLQGERQEDACAAVPGVCDLLEKRVPEITAFKWAEVVLSRMPPGTHVKPHCGRSNMKLRIHCGLKVILVSH